MFKNVSRNVRDGEEDGGGPVLKELEPVPAVFPLPECDRSVIIIVSGTCNTIVLGPNRQR